MSFFNFEFVTETITKPNHIYWPHIVVTDDIPDWPWTLTLFASTDHATGSDGATYLYGCVGDPSIKSNWETYDQALAAGRFAAFPTKPAGNPIYQNETYLDAETPTVNKVGNAWYMTTHVGIAGNNQPTVLATSADLLNWTTHPVRTGGVILSSSLDGNWPRPDTHRGYFKWGQNPFAGIPYAYIGWSLHGGGDAGVCALRGSDDAINWNVITLLRQGTVEGGELPEGWELKWNSPSPSTVRATGNGEYMVLVGGGTPAWGTMARDNDQFEIGLAADGYTITRAPRRLTWGGGGGGQIFTYQGVDYFVGGRTNPDTGVAAIVLWTVTYDYTADKGVPLSLPNHDRYHVKAVDGALPAGVSRSGGSLTWAGDYVAIANGAAVFVDAVPSNAGWLEVATKTHSGGASNVLPAVGVGDTRAAFPPSTGVYYQRPSAGGRIRRRQGGNELAPVLNPGYPYDSDNNWSREHWVGLRWDAAADEISLSAEAEYRRYTAPGEATPIADLPQQLFAGTAANGPWRVREIIFRVGTSGPGVAPTITSAVADNITVQVALSTACIGDGDGITVRANGVEVDGAWSRPDASSLVLTRTSGQFGAADTLTLDIAGTDIRHAEALVAIQPLAGFPIANNADVGPGEAPVLLARISARASLIGATVSLNASAHFAGADSYSASGLPAGLNIDATTGVISGTLTEAEVASVTVTAANAGGSTVAAFTWTVLAEAPQSSGRLTITSTVVAPIISPVVRAIIH